MRRLSENLYLLEDTCNVYLVKSGDQGILVDFGSGAVLERLEEAGVTRITDVLMTHHHRDQGQGLAKAAELGIPIWVPHAEQDLYRSVNEHWQARELYNSYNNRQDRFSLLESVPVTGTLKDYSTYFFGDHAFEVLPTPGHTTGSLSLLAHIDGRRVAFTGDLIAAPGKLWSLAATQWSYNGAEGVAASGASLLELKERAPDVLLPSHGAPMKEPMAAIDLLTERLWALLRERGQNPRLFELCDKPFERLIPHLLRNRSAMATHYVLLSKSGKALFIDFGYDCVTGIAAGTDRASRRPWLYSLPVLRRDFGVTSIDVALPTHYHDDHVAGLNLLRDVHGTKVWAAELFADVLERPERYDLPCLWYDPIPVNRVLPLGTPIAWEEHTLTLHHLPGHTLYAVAVSFEVDGRRVLAIGDQYQGGEEAQTNYVYKNGFEIDDYLKSAALVRALEPDLILSGHWEPLWVSSGYFDALDVRGEALARLHRELLPLETVDFGVADAGVTIRPYQVVVAAGEDVAMELEVKNPFATAEEATVRLVLPEGWRAEPESQTVHMGPHETQIQAFLVKPRPEPVRRARLAADLTVGGRRFGQQAEALVTVQDED